MEEKNYNFEEFTGFKSKFSTKISVGKSGFGFSSGLYNKYSLDNYKALKVFFDKANNAIAFKFYAEPESGTIKLKKRSGGGYLGGRSFFGKYSIDPTKYANKYEPREIEYGQLGKVLVIDLKEKIT